MKNSQQLKKVIETFEDIPDLTQSITSPTSALKSNAKPSASQSKSTIPQKKDTNKTQDEQPLQFFQVKVDLNMDYLEKFLRSMQQMQLQTAKTLNQVIDKIESDDDKQEIIMLKIDDLEKRMTDTLITIQNVQEKCVQIESKSLQLASRVKDLGSTIDQESELRRQIDQERKKDFTQQLDDIRGKIEGLDQDIQKQSQKFINFEQFEFDIKMNQRLQEPLEKIQQLEEEVAMIEEQYDQDVEHNNTKKTINIDTLSLKNQDNYNQNQDLISDEETVSNFQQNKESGAQQLLQIGANGSGTHKKTFNRQMTKFSGSGGFKRSLGGDIQDSKEAFEKRISDLEKAFYVFGVGIDQNQLQNNSIGQSPQIIHSRTPASTHQTPSKFNQKQQVFNFRKLAADNNLFSDLTPQNQSSLSPEDRAKLREEIIMKVLNSSEQKFNENMIIELYNKHQLMTSELSFYQELFDFIRNQNENPSRDSKTSQELLKQKMHEVGLNLVGDVDNLKKEFESQKLTEEKYEQLELDFRMFKERIQQEVESVINNNDDFTFKIRQRSSVKDDELSSQLEPTSDDQSKAQALVKQLKRELLLDINLNKEFVRNYELAARRLENVFMNKIDAEKLKTFDQVLQLEVKDFLGLTTTGKKLQDLDFKVNLATNSINQLQEQIGARLQDLDVIANLKDAPNIAEKFKNIDVRLQDIFQFYNKYQMRFVQTFGSNDDAYSSDEDMKNSPRNISRQKSSKLHQIDGKLSGQQNMLGDNYNPLNPNGKSPPQSPGQRKKKRGFEGKRISILNVKPSPVGLTQQEEIDHLKNYTHILELKLNELFMKFEDTFPNDYNEDGEGDNQNNNSANKNKVTDDVTQLTNKVKQLNQEIVQLRSSSSKQQLQIVRLDQEVNRLDQQRQTHDFDKIYKTVQENYELLKKYIDEVNSYSKDFYERITSKMNFKADTDFFQKYQSNVEEKIVNELNRKIDKIELKRTQNAIRRKIDQLEDKVIDLKNPKNNGPSGPVALSNTNNKCISCYRDLPLDEQQLLLALQNQTPTKPSTSAHTDRVSVYNQLSNGQIMIPFTNIPLTNKYLFRELAQKGPKYGLGFSRILTKLQPEQLETLQNQHQLHHQHQHVAGFLSHRGLTSSQSRQDLISRQSLPRLSDNLAATQSVVGLHNDSQDNRHLLLRDINTAQIKPHQHQQSIGGSVERKISLKLPSPKNSYNSNNSHHQQISKTQQSFRKKPSNTHSVNTIVNSKLQLQSNSQQTGVGSSSTNLQQILL
eukprot:403369571